MSIKDTLIDQVSSVEIANLSEDKKASVFGGLIESAAYGIKYPDGVSWLTMLEEEEIAILEEIGIPHKRTKANRVIISSTPFGESSYKSAKSIISQCLDRGISLTDSNGVRGKSELQKLLKEHKEGAESGGKGGTGPSLLKAKTMFITAKQYVEKHGLARNVLVMIDGEEL